MGQKWWKEAVVYEIYPRSFLDTNSDGIGDLQGIIKKLDYIQNLGANVIWLCPIYDSPNADNGYDIRDYQKISADFGTMEDFDLLLNETHRRGMKLIMDLVVNHTSDEHRWFQESRKSRENPYRNYYFWREGKKSGPPNNWESCFSGSAWSYDEQTKMYYLHLFSSKQPDLNWDNPEVRNAVYQIMHWWLQKGVDGFRMDVISFISKDTTFPDGPKKDGTQYGEFGSYAINGPHVHEYLHEMNQKVLSQYDIMTVGETPDVTIQEALKYAGDKTGELNMVFQFEHMDLDTGEHGKWSNNRFQLCDLKQVLSKWQTELEGRAWNSLFWSNHDQPRAVSRFGNDTSPLYWEKSAKMLATCLYMMKGTPFIYQGEELGMTNVPFKQLEDYRDIETKNAYDELVYQQHVPAETMMEYIHHASRDNARAPMQWNKKKNAGFSDVEPWIKVNPNYVSINAEDQQKDPNSIYHYYRKLIDLRKRCPIIIQGKYELIEETHSQIFAYTRSLNLQNLLVVCSFSEEDQDFKLPEKFCTDDKKLLISNWSVNKLEDKGSEIHLHPYEARVYLL
jgi:oligo-1,6-glucosidase